MSTKNTNAQFFNKTENSAHNVGIGVKIQQHEVSDSDESEKEHKQHI